MSNARHTRSVFRDVKRGAASSQTHACTHYEHSVHSVTICNQGFVCQISLEDFLATGGTKQEFVELDALQIDEHSALRPKESAPDRRQEEVRML